MRKFLSLIVAILTLCVCFGFPKFITLSQTVSLSANEIHKRAFAGNECSFVIKDDGSLWGWGRNKGGRLGDGTEINRINPVKIMDDVASYTGSYNSGFAIKTDNSLWGWGLGVSGLFSGTQLTPVRLMDNVVQVSSDGIASMILKTDGSLWLTGWIMGSKTGIRYDQPQQIMTDVIYACIEAGVFQVIKEDGSLWLFGEKAYEALGMEGEVSIPVKVMDNVAHVTSDYGVTYIITNDGGLWGLGKNSMGILIETDSLSLNSEIITTPVKLDDNVSPRAEIYFGGNPSNLLEYGSLYYVKNDDTLWKRISYYISDSRNGSKHGYYSVKIMDNVKYIDSSGNYHMFIVQNNGDIWSIGRNEYGQLGDGTADVKFDSTVVTNITKTSEAVLALENAISTMDSFQKDSPANINNLSRYAEELLAKTANKDVSESEINIDKDFVNELLVKSSQTQRELQDILTSYGIDPFRELNKNISITTSSERGFTVTVQLSVLETDFDNIFVQNGTIGIVINRENLESAEPGMPVQVSATVRTGPTFAFEPNVLLAALLNEQYEIEIINTKSSVKAQASVKVGTPPAQLAASDANGAAVISQYNAANGKMEYKTSESGVFTVKEKIVDFKDISGLSQETQNAIKYLANKNVVFGANADSFMPNKYVSRAEITSLLVRASSKQDRNANVSFTDVPKSEWYYTEIASAYKMGIVNGTSATTFEPTKTMLKDQILAVSARLLKVQRGYKTPANPNDYLTRFNDKNNISDWSKSDLALAIKLDIVNYRSDGNFLPKSSISRADAALVLYRTFQLIW